MSRQTELWPDAQPEAHELAKAWADGLEGRVLDVRSSPDGSSPQGWFAVIGRPTALPSASPQRALNGAFERLFGPITVLDAPRPHILRGRAERDDRVYHVGLVSSGATHAAVVFAVGTADEAAMHSAIDGAFLDLRGMSPPVRPFHHRRARWLMLLSYIGIGVLLWGLLSATTSLSEAMMGRRIGATIALLGLVVFFVARRWVESQGSNLAIVGESAMSIAVELSVLSLLPAAVFVGYGGWRTAKRRTIADRAQNPRGV